ncbi:hypothetical protein A2303_02620 [Candidatus Falkowbacteria bacterium RIFOXYB2_FULL_47_14]|uniref:Transposase IS200-like domain-containing protein n=1 Tax=Candidatus Falkowbacteria bacterium RIFOXYA2_FULL_47_19 TaxID=1797994 RepID=A0A1F5SGY3_9BACT|nr:MAG: hypothetical protein A2227_05815 [Candidatus Falkowbacteria bacterium RIFOXYA2_FULL_47_19]OGF34529.1 MAG: hypothetical protein A2468_04855 [Candidatus Falkowbacteria bacterium RIFOXYC2_FULL_46_15]OGF43016.1 MAG: hypothetical protein A2303_02620 [Candidatus Falkowbacteria bacterium RIFOXYB2_FULL_47_14]
MQDINPYRYKNKYRIASARRSGWDYANSGFYYITTCTDGEEYFGNIVNFKNGEACVELSEIGEIADKFWREIPAHFPFVALDKYVIMPNHVHGIVVINENLKDVARRDAQCRDAIRRDAINRVSTVATNTINRVSTGAVNTIGGITGKYNPMGSGSLGEIVRWYKRRCKFETKKIHVDFSWQSRYYDRIISDEEELNRIRQYLADNPKSWPLDRNNKKAL